MENLHAGASALENGKLSHSLGQPFAIGVDTIDELGKVFHNTLQMKDENSGIGSNVPSDDHDKNLDGSKANPNKCLHKCATFPVGTEEKTPNSQPENHSYTRSLSLPTAPKLVSAIKGSREKEGTPPRKLTVSWAPDVYDPLPTSLSHYPKKKTQQQFKYNKKHGKGKHKSKSTRGGSGGGSGGGGSGQKDKKHYRKTGGSGGGGGKSDFYVNTCKSSTVGLMDFDVVGSDIGCSDSNCASSFLGKTGAMHYAYAEAT